MPPSTPTNQAGGRSGLFASAVAGDDAALTSDTCWTVIREAAAGDASARERFALRYEGAVRAYLGARWGGPPLAQDVDDAVQDVFVECFKDDGAAGAARHAEAVDPDDLAAADTSLSVVFDRAWAHSVMRETAERLRAEAEQAGESARRRVELLRLRFQSGLPIREIAQRWQMDAARLHHDYARARQDFLKVLRTVVAFHRPGTVAEIDQECADLLALLA
jgi:RNA polymerase sigma-70 factor (ECF subfamily)